MSHTGMLKELRVDLFILLKETAIIQAAEMVLEYLAWTEKLQQLQKAL